MGRKVRDASLETRAARLRLAARPKPYPRLLTPGLHQMYRRPKRGGDGAWIARGYAGKSDGTASPYIEEMVGLADDYQEANGVTVLDFGQAQIAIRDWWAKRQHRDESERNAGPLTVAAALADYFEWREGRRSKGIAADRTAAEARIVPALGDLAVDKLTTARLRRWLNDLAKAPRLQRAKATAIERPTRPHDVDDPEAVRARHATANRILTVLKAALNHAFHEGRVGSDVPWRKVKPFREVDAPVVRYLTAAECVRLVNGCEGRFRDLVRAALLTGCRYGELTRMRAADFDGTAGTVTVRLSKAGKPRHVALTDEGRMLFSSLTAYCVGTDLIFLRDDGKPWGASHQQRPLEEASRRAAIDPPATFHILRHAYASALAMKGVPMGVIAAQLGHADTRMTERHYAHLGPSYVADTVRAALPALGIVPVNNVLSIAS